MLYTNVYIQTHILFSQEHAAQRRGELGIAARCGGDPRIFTVLYAFSLFYTHFYYFIRIFYHFASIFYAHHTHSRTSHTRHVLYTHVLRASRALRHALRTDARTRSCVNASMRAARMPTRASAFDAAREYCARVRYEGGPRACCG